MYKGVSSRWRVGRRIPLAFALGALLATTAIPNVKRARAAEIAAVPCESPASTPASFATALEGVSRGVARCDEPAEFADAGFAACGIEKFRDELRVYDRACGPVIYRARKLSPESALLRRMQLIFLFNREYEDIARMNPNLAEYAPRWSDFEARWKRILREDPGAAADSSAALAPDNRSAIARRGARAGRGALGGGPSRGALARRVAAIPKLQAGRAKDFAEFERQAQINRPHLLQLVSASIMLQALDAREAKIDAGRIARAENARRAAKRAEYRARLVKGRDTPDAANIAEKAVANAFPEVTFRDVLQQRRDALYRAFPELLKDDSLREKALAIVRPAVNLGEVNHALMGDEGRAESERMIAADPTIGAGADEQGFAIANQEVQMRRINASVYQLIEPATGSDSRRRAEVSSGLAQLDRSFQKTAAAIRDERLAQLEPGLRDPAGLYRHLDLTLMTASALDPVAGRRMRQALISRHCTTEWSDASLAGFERGAMIAGGTVAMVTGVGALGLSLGSAGLATLGGAGWSATAGAMGTGALYMGLGGLAAGSALSAAEVGQAYGHYVEAQNKFYANLGSYHDVESARVEFHQASVMAGLNAGAMAVPTLGGLAAARIAAPAAATAAAGRSVDSAATSALRTAGARAVTAARVAGEVGINGALIYSNIHEQNYLGMGMMGMGLALAYGKQGAAAFRYAETVFGSGRVSP